MLDVTSDTIPVCVEKHYFQHSCVAATRLAIIAGPRVYRVW